MGATIYTGYRNHSRFYLTWSEGGQDVANNRTLIHWTVGVQGEPGWTAYWYSNAIRLHSAYLDGQGNLASGVWSNITLANGATVPLRSGSVWVGHNNDGTKGFSATVHGWFYGHGDVAADGWWQIATIQRQARLTNLSQDITDMDNPWFEFSNPAGFGTYTWFEFPYNTGTNRYFQVQSWSRQTYNFTEAQRNVIRQIARNQNQMTIRYVLETSMAGNPVDWRDRTYTITNANPLFSNFTYRDSNAAVVAITGNDQILVKGQSTLETTVSSANKMVAVKMADPSRYSILFDGVTKQQAYSASGSVVTTFTDPRTIGQNTIVVTAFDSRNNNTSASKQVTVYDYSAPTIESTLTRENNFGVNTTVHLEGDFTPLVIGGEAKNAIVTGSLQYRYREVDGAFSAWIPRTFTVDQAVWKMTADFVVTLDNTKKYEFEFQVADKFQTVYSARTVDVGKPILFVGEDNGTPSVGVGKLPENGALDVEGDVYANGLRLAPEPQVSDPNSAWTKYDFGSFIQWRRTGQSGYSIGAGGWQTIDLTSGAVALPPGMTSIGNYFVEGHASTNDSAVSVNLYAAPHLDRIKATLSNNYGGTVANTIYWSVCLTSQEIAT